MATEEYNQTILEYATLAEIWAEIEKRYPTALILCSRTGLGSVDDPSDEISMYHTMPIFNVIGLTKIAQELLLGRQLSILGPDVDSFIGPDEDDDDDEDTLDAEGESDGSHQPI